MEPLIVPRSLTVPYWFAAGVIGGVVATLGMDRVTPLLSEGKTPPYIASGVLTERPPGAAPGRLASVVHYVAGMLTGPLFVWLLFVSGGLLDGQAPAGSVAATLAAAGVLYVLMLGFFAVVVLPRSQVDGQRVGRIRRAWAVSAAVYLVVLVPVVALAGRLV